MGRQRLLMGAALRMLRAATVAEVNRPSIPLDAPYSGVAEVRTPSGVVHRATNGNAERIARARRGVR
jgi:hypothetical protein